MSDERKFRTVFDRVRIYSNPGSPIEHDYIIKLDSDGTQYIEISGTYNIDDEIQSYADSCDLSKIIERFCKTGDPSILMQRQGFYGDMEELPSDFTEMIQMSNAYKDFMNELSPEARVLLEEDPAAFFAQLNGDNVVISDSSSVESEVIDNE